MPRIRSVHPGFFTDEAFAQLSDSAQIFLIALLTEADDQGVFGWKPLTLKMRLRPASTSSVEPLLDELRAGNCIRKFNADGRQYGAVRNFCRFQRPKKPNSIHPLPAELRTYVGMDGGSSEPDQPSNGDGSEPPPIYDLVSSEPTTLSNDGSPEPIAQSGARSSEPKPVQPAPVPKKSEFAPQMEEEGGRREEESAKQASSVPKPRASWAAPPGPKRWDDPAIEAGGPDLKLPADDPWNVANQDRPSVRGHYLDSTFEKACDAAGIDLVRSTADWRPVVAWLKEGIEPETIIAVIRRRAERAGYTPPNSLAYFDKAVREAAVRAA